MTRVLLTAIGLAVLRLGAPQAASAPDLGPRGESVRPVPTSEAPSSKGTLAPAAVRLDEVRSADATSFLPAAPVGLGLEPAGGELSTPEPARSAPTRAPYRISLPRAPPA